MRGHALAAGFLELWRLPSKIAEQRDMKFGKEFGA